MHWLETLVPPPVVALALAAAMGAAGSLPPDAELPWPARLVGGMSLALAAAVYGARAMRAFGRAGTTIDPIRVERVSSLVTTGIYAHTRNPMYVALALLLAALAASLGRLVPGLGPILFVAYVTRFQIVPEERWLVMRFGDPYRAYRLTVPRWLF